MSFFSRLFGSNKKQDSIEHDDLVEANVCPNCWGIQEYDHKFVQYKEDQTKANINHDKTHRKAFIQQFVESHVDGIHLKNDGKHLHCPECKVKYKRH